MVLDGVTGVRCEGRVVVVVVMVVVDGGAVRNLESQVKTKSSCLIRNCKEATA